MKEIIINKLKEIEQNENIDIILAVEVGSRAWGFASKDSDYDVRFIYIRKLEDYLKLEKIKDIIEWQLDDTLDINGWDLKKALQLMYDSNPSIFEWLSSPIVYKNSDSYNELKSLSKNYYSRKKNIYHYLHMATSNYNAYLKKDEVKIKKYFYVLRPILTAKWIIDKEEEPPMLFSKLIDEELPLELKPIINNLLELKHANSDMDVSTKIKELDNYINKEFETIKIEAEKVEPIKTDWTPLDDFFYKTIVK